MAEIQRRQVGRRAGDVSSTDRVDVQDVACSQARLSDASAKRVAPCQAKDHRPVIAETRHALTEAVTGDEGQAASFAAALTV